MERLRRMPGDKERAGLLTEFDLIATVFRPLADAPGALALLDDAAYLTPPSGHELIVTTDAMVSGIHFFANDPPALIGRKLLRVNLSDLAAKGADAAGYLLTLALPAVDEMWLRAFAAGLKEDQDAFAVSLLGGDTVSTTGPLMLSVTALGWVPAGGMLRRAGARIGDDIYVSGTIGDAALALQTADAQAADPDDEVARHLRRRFLLPQPRCALGQALRGIASACADISDGLVADLGHLCTASGVGAEVEVAAVPLSGAAAVCIAARPTLLETALTGGDDYELVFTAAASQAERLATLGPERDVPITRVGRVTAANRVVLIGADGSEMPVGRPGFRHF